MTPTWLVTCMHFVNLAYAGGTDVDLQLHALACYVEAPGDIESFYCEKLFEQRPVCDWLLSIRSE